jgi:hypothetical protein
MAFCPNCGEKVSDDDAFCASCGNSLTGTQLENQEREPTSSSNDGNVVSTTNTDQALGEERRHDTGDHPTESGNQFKQERSDIAKPLWWFGWRIKESLIYCSIAVLVASGLLLDSWAVGFAIALFFGPFVGLAVWVSGVWYVNDNFERVKRSYFQDHRNHARSILAFLGEDINLYTLEGGKGSVFGIQASERYEPTTLAMGEASVGVYDDSALGMKELQTHFGDHTREFYYDNITTVRYEEPYLEIKTSDGSTMQFQSSREPDDALHDLQERLREFKQRPAR